jgi:hypothetical protein
MALLFFSLFLLVGETTCGGFETLGGDKTHCFISRLRLVGGWLPSLTFWIEFKFQHFLMCVVISFVFFSLSISPFLAQSSFFLSLCFFFFGWLDQCYEGKPKFHCWSSKGKPKMPLVPPLSLCFLFVILCIPRSPLVSGLSLAFIGRENALAVLLIFPG